MKFFILFLLLIISCNKKEKILSNKNLTNKELAIQIAEKKFNEVYGVSIMEKEKLFKAEKFNDSIWVVKGTMKKPRIGGVAFGQVNIRNNKVINYSHGE